MFYLNYFISLLLCYNYKLLESKGQQLKCHYYPVLQHNFFWLVLDGSVNNIRATDMDGDVESKTERVCLTQSENGHVILLDTEDQKTTTTIKYRKSNHYGLSQRDYDVKYGRRNDERSERLCTSLRKRMRCTRSCTIDYLRQRFPIYDVILTYRFRDYILGDILSGNNDTVYDMIVEGGSGRQCLPCF